MGAAFKVLSVDEVNEVQGIFISVDPDRDTLDKVSQYASFFHPNIIGLTGTSDEIEVVAKRYFVVYQKVNHEDLLLGYTLDHSTTTYIIGRNGQVVELIRHDTTVEEVVQSIRATLNG